MEINELKVLFPEGNMKVFSARPLYNIKISVEHLETWNDIESPETLKC